jgi:hypothetical protein
MTFKVHYAHPTAEERAKAQREADRRWLIGVLVEAVEDPVCTAETARLREALVKAEEGK